MTSPAVGSTGRRLGRYHLAEPLGGGPTGEVYRAKVYGVAGFEREFAIKRFHPGFVNDPDIAAKLAAAARNYASLEHPRIARLHEYGVAAGETFTATELAQGVDTARLVSMLPGLELTLPLGAAVALVSQAARAVGYAHGRGMLHLGLCPTNVLVTPDGDVKITDFCFLPTRLPDRPGDDPTLRARMPYLAPEQLVGEPTGAATDVYQLGVIAYEVLTGRPPFTGASAPEIAQRILASRPRVPALPAPVLEVVQRCLGRSPFERYPDARALADALDAAVRAAQAPGDHRDLAVVVRALLAKIDEVSDGQSSGAVSFPLPSPPMATPRAVTDAGSDRLPSYGPDGTLDAVRAGMFAQAPSAGRVGTLPTLEDEQGALQELDEDLPTTLRSRDDEILGRPRTNDFTAPGLAPPVGRAATPRLRPRGASPRPGASQGRPGAPPGGPPPGAAAGPPLAGSPGARRPGPGRGAEQHLPAPGLPEEADSAVETVVSLGQPLGQSLDALASDAGASDSMSAIEEFDGASTVIGVPSLPSTGAPTGRPVPSSAPAQPPSAAPPRPPTAPPRMPTSAPPRVSTSAPPRAPAAEPPGAGADPRLSSAPDRPGGGPLLESMPLPSPPRSEILPATVPEPEGLGPFADRASEFDENVVHTELHARPRGRGLLALGAVVVAVALVGGGYLVYQRLLAGDEPAQAAAEIPAATEADAGTDHAQAPDRAVAAAGVADAGAPEEIPANRPALSAAVGGSLEMQDEPADKLIIRSQPARAKVYLDGSLQGRTPLTLDATADQHTVAVIQPGHRLFTAALNGHGTVDITLEEVVPPGGEGGIKIRCRKKNRYYVLLNGNDSGQLCPTERIGADVGDHVIEIYDPETESRQEFRVTVEQTRRSTRLRVD